VAEVGDSPKFFKILRIEIENYPIIKTMGMYWGYRAIHYKLIRRNIEISTVNSSPAIMRLAASYFGVIFFRTAFMLWPSYNGHFWGYIFFGGIFPSKIGRFAPFLATIKALSKTRVFLYT
jgi:hypothetical protein